MGKVYVYLHRRKDTGEVFYVGIGIRNRPYQKTYNRRNKIWKDIINKTDYDVEIIYEVDSWIQACVIEIMLIQKYGRKDLGLGTLANMTDGGDGTLGAIHSQESRIKRRKSMKGKNSGKKNGMWGKKHSKEFFKKLKERNLPKGEQVKNSKLTKEDVLWIRNNGIQGTDRKNRGNVTEIAKKFNVSRNTINRVISRKIWKHI